MEKSLKVTEILLKALKLFTRFILGGVILFILAAGLLQIPAIQTKATKILTGYISENTGFKSEIERVNIRWWDALSLGDVRIYDLEDSLMVNLEEVYIDFSVSGLMDKENPGFDEIKLKSGLVRILTHPTSGGPNISTFLTRINFIINPVAPDKEKRSGKFSIDNVSFEKTSLDIINYNIEPIAEGFDYGKMRFRELVADADDFYVQGDTIGFNLNTMRGVESTSGMVFQQLRTDYIYSSTGMEFNNLLLKSNGTEIKNYLKFTYDDVTALNDFNNQVNVMARLDESILDIKDLKYFSRQFPAIDDKIYLSGDINGRVSDFSSDQLLIRFGDRSALFGKFNIQGLPDIDKTFFNLSLMNSTLTSNDLSPYISEEAQKEVNKFKEIRFDSDFTGFLKDFSTKGVFRTSIGRIAGNLNYKATDSLPTYNGRVELVDLDLGVIMEDKETFQKVSMKGQIKGSGMTVETALLELRADVENIGINHYNYTKINTNATYGKDLFNGVLSIEDPNLKMTLDGTFDLRNEKDSARLVANLDTAFLQELNLLEKDAFLSGNFQLDTKGINIDEIEGVARFSDVYISYEGRNLFMDDFIFQSLFTEDSRLVSLNSDLLVAGISGNFEVAEVARDIKKLWQDYYAIITNSEVSQSKASIEGLNEYNIDINIDFKDPNPIINLIDPSLSISKSSLLEGAFYRTSENTIFNFFSAIDTVYYKGNYFIDNNIDFNTSKIHNSTEVLAAFYIFSKNQKLNSGINFHDFSLEAIWDESVVDLSMGVDQLQTESYARINSIINISDDHTSIVFEPSDIKLIDKFWEFEEDNLITVTQKDIVFKNLMIFNGNQFLSANGKINQNPEDFLHVEINELNLNFLNTFDLKEFEGTANGLFALNGFYDNTGTKGDLQIRDLYINNFLIGDIEATTDFENERPNLHLMNFREGKMIIEINGSMGSDNEDMDMTANLNEANLSVLEPFLSRYLTEMGGTLSGKFKIDGSMVEPEVVGTGKLSEGTLRINYLNTFYTVNGNVSFVPNEINFNGLSLTDVQGNKASFRGGITHDNFNNFVLDISSDLSNFQVLNTSLNDNELFYGTAYASGELDIFGAANNLDLTARATTQPNTRIYIPIGYSNGQFQEEFINIINVRDTTQFIGFEKTVDKLAINNVRMNFDLDVTPDAYTEIQIDPRTGENIQGRGRGVLNLGIDTQGNFSMRGNYEIVDAVYNFSLYNVINKRFVIEPGGKIAWYGDPYGGVMNLKAVYEENVSLISLQDNTMGSEMESSQMKRKYPLKIIMGLNGPLLSPDIAFDFDFSNFPEGELQIPISAFKNRIANDEQEKNRQVFSLIMLRRFSPAGQFSGAGIGFSNLTQLISSQLNSLISQVDQNLEIDFDLASLDETAFESFQLRVAYTFLDGRLRVMRDGGFTDFQGNADLNSIAGDWQAEYLLTEDGRYVIRVYNRTNFDNSLTSLNIKNPNTYGISISQTLLFSSFKELFQNTRSEIERLRMGGLEDLPSYDLEEVKLDEPLNIDEIQQKSDKPPIHIYEHPKDFRKGE
ncbi:MAG: translocation/assembly module TamB domain-containing protein [Anditalea sp.]